MLRLAHRVRDCTWDNCDSIPLYNSTEVEFIWIFDGLACMIFNQRWLILTKYDNITTCNMMSFQNIYIGFPRVSDVIWAFYPTSCVFSIPEPHHKAWEIFFKNIFTTPYLFLLTLFFGKHGVGIYNVITKIYQMSFITLISRTNCNKCSYMLVCDQSFDKAPTLLFLTYGLSTEFKH
jgi:hypothetical protein